MDVRLVAAVAGPKINVSAFCREVGISRETFYFWQRRYREAGLAGLEDRSSAPRTSPHRTPESVEDEVVCLRKQLTDDGLDNGADTIRALMVRSGHGSVPSVATVWRILVRRGFVVPAPNKRPNKKWRRFNASVPNELWQADATKWTIATGQVEILVFLDDCSRLVTGCRAVLTATTDNTWATFQQATTRWGIPLGQLNDNGLNFSGRLRGFEVRFEIELRAAGVRPIVSTPFHPQTCGKVERFHQTLKKWLRARPLASDLDALQQQLDTFIAYYNHERPHRALNNHTPIEAFNATPRAINPQIPLPAPEQTATLAVTNRGLITINPWVIHVGVAHAGKQARVMLNQTHAAVFIENQLVRHLELDRTRTYQPSGLPRGGPRQRPLP